LIVEKPRKSPRKQSRQQRRYSRTQEKILIAARTVFSEKGLVASTVEDIVERADVGRGSFYYHFENKDEVIRRVIERILAELVEKINTQCSGQDDLRSVLDAMIGAHIEFFANRWEDFVLYYQGRADLTLQESYEGLETPFMEYITTIEKLVDDVVPEPISKPRLRRLACAVAGFISGYYSFASVAGEDADVDKSFRLLRKAFVVGLARFVKEALPAS
jgi:AcrR family transcriptional regulator